MVPNDDMNPLFLATVQSVEESVANALIAAKTMKGINDHEVRAIPHAELQQLLKKYNRLVEPMK
jgi:D-aminopeptidase